MDLLFYIQVKPIQSIGFGNPFSTWARAHIPGIQLLEADNHSEDFVINHELSMIAEAEKVAVIIEAQAASPGLVVKVLERIIRRKKEQSMIILNGENEHLEKMLKMMRGPVHKNQSQEQTEQLLADFYS